MIRKIEKLRIESGKSKAWLARKCEVSSAMYYKYLSGSPLPYLFVVRAFRTFGYDLYLGRIELEKL